MEDYSIEVRGEVQQIYKVLTKEDEDKMPFQGIEIAKTLTRIPFFRRYFDTNCEQFVNLCIGQSVVQFQEGVDVYEQQKLEGREKYLYVVLEGALDIESHECRSRKLGILNIFGQLEIVFGLQNRRERAIVRKQCKLMRIREQSILKVFSHQQSLKKCLHFLAVNPYFEELNQLEKMHLTLGLTKRSFSKGEVLKLEGDGMQTVLFFIYGRADVSVILKQKQYVIDSLEEMSSLGEYECVSDSQTTFKVKGVFSGAYYYMSYSEMKEQGHRITQIIKEHAIPYPSNENLMFLEGVKSTLKKEEKRVMKTLK